MDRHLASRITHQLSGRKLDRYAANTIRALRGDVPQTVLAPTFAITQGCVSLIQGNQRMIPSSSESTSMARVPGRDLCCDKVGFDTDDMGRTIEMCEVHGFRLFGRSA